MNQCCSHGNQSADHKTNYEGALKLVLSYADHKISNSGAPFALKSLLYPRCTRTMFHRLSIVTMMLIGSILMHIEGLPVVTISVIATLCSTVWFQNRVVMPRLWHTSCIVSFIIVDYDIHECVEVYF